VSAFKDSKPENNLGGFEFKANVAKKHQFYGQLLVDHVNLKELSKGSGWWNNRFGVQLGAKTINLFGINNLDLQVEMNAVRPYTYSADSLGSYTHFNQPLAHPLGANFFEGIGILHYQPHKRINLQLKLISWKQGSDSANVNFGGNIRRNANLRLNDYGFTIPSGVEVTAIKGSALIEYEILENVTIEGLFTIRRYSFEGKLRPLRDSLIFCIGARVNLEHRSYDY
jgi:hypothetical protein